jgi:nucleotide-binding universal stress UspA family protein
MFQKILLASDGSENAMRAARIARELCEKFGAQVMIVCVAHIPLMYRVDLAEELEEGIGQEWQRILDYTADIFAGSKVTFQTRLLRDVSPVDGILTEYEAGGYDLIVMGRTGEGRSPRKNFGSVTLSVMQQMHSSILIV